MNSCLRGPGMVENRNKLVREGALSSHSTGSYSDIGWSGASGGSIWDGYVIRQFGVVVLFLETYIWSNTLKSQ